MTECVKALKDALTLACKGTPLAAALETGVIECCTQYQTTRKARTRIPEQLAEICSIRFFRLTTKRAVQVLTKSFDFNL